jgi:FkbM family methyltransferase
VTCSEQRRTVKHVVNVLIDAVPALIMEPVLRGAALAPPILKTWIFERLCTRALRSQPHADWLVETNLGVSAYIRCRTPIYKSSYAFGRPENNIGERGTIALVSELSRDCLHFLDVGANEGIFIFSVFALQKKGIEIHWFEPDDALAERLTDNLEGNSIATYGNKVAVSDRTGYSTFFKNLTDASSGSLTAHFAEKHTIRQERVETVSLTDYFLAKGISKAIIKIDVEGAGAQVWSGTERCVNDILYMIIECLEPEITSRLPAKIIASTGWYAYYIRDFDLIEAPNGEFEYVEPFWNWLFCRLDSLALAERLSRTKFRVVTGG